MCIAIYVPANKDINDDKIRNAFANNKDGAGVMHYDRHGQVHYTKGFMDVESLIKYWRHSTSSKFPRAIHCRIATSGKISKGCCHPFPITNNLDDMLKPSGIGMNGCLIHNGVFSRYTPKEGMASPYSDTMFFTQKVIFPVADLLNNSGVEELLSDMTSKVLVFLPNFEVHRYGKWEYESEDGFYASNDTYSYDWNDWKRWYSTGSYSTYKPYSYDNIGTTVYDSCTGKTSTLANKWDDWEEEEKPMTDGYGIAVCAETLEKAKDLMYDFIDRYWNSLVDGGWDTYESLERYDDTTWLFYVTTHQDISNAIDQSLYTVYEHCRYDKDGNIIYDEFEKVGE